MLKTSIILLTLLFPVSAVAADLTVIIPSRSYAKDSVKMIQEMNKVAEKYGDKVIVNIQFPGAMVIGGAVIECPEASPTPTPIPTPCSIFDKLMGRCK
jgi:hypothetical protein